MPPSLISINLNIDLNELVSKVWNKFLVAVGKDQETQELRTWLEDQTKIAFIQSRDVQCIGMHSPVLLSEIYQPTVLVRDRPQVIRDQASQRQWEARDSELIPVKTFLAQVRSSIIVAGPGWGKTTFLHAVYLYFLSREADKVLPVLFTLRNSDAVSGLEMFVTKMAEIKALAPDRRILLLVDGYDEIPMESRKSVSEAILKFASKNVGQYLLTCRDYYEILDLNAPRLRIDEFTEDDQISFVRAFLHAYGARADAAEIVQDLHKRGFSHLLRHPLLLTLACIVRSGSVEIQSRNVVSLIENAISTLSLRWDQGKGLKRESTTPLDSSARVKCLKRIAFLLDLEPASQSRVVGITKKQLESMRWEDVDPLQVLWELARFYGIFVPVTDRWGFVHRSIQDFLAAQYWVETGQFARALTQNNLKLDSRTAFAGCIIDDATEVMEYALARSDGLPVFAEMLMNDPSFNHPRIAKAIEAYCARFKGEHYYQRTPEKIECYLEEDFITNASSKFLDFLIQSWGTTPSKTSDTLAAYAIIELHHRRKKLSRAAFEACKKNLKTDKFIFDVRKKNIVRFCDVGHSAA